MGGRMVADLDGWMVGLLDACILVSLNGWMVGCLDAWMLESDKGQQPGADCILAKILVNVKVNSLFFLIISFICIIIYTKSHFHLKIYIPRDHQREKQKIAHCH